MEIVNHRYEEIISVDNLLVCWREFRKNKANKLDVMAFERRLEDNIFSLHEELADRKYSHASYTTFHIYDPKHRIISKATVKDRLVHHVIFNELYRVFESSFIYHSYASRLEKGTHLAVQNAARALRKVSCNNTRSVYVLKCDIKKFFDSVDHKKLEQIIQKKITDKKLLLLIHKIISSFNKRINKRQILRNNRGGGELIDQSVCGSGVPIGNVTSQIFANIYLNELDQFVKHKLRAKYYFRYADDFIIIHNDPTYLQNTLKSISQFLQKNLYLELHPQKVEIRKYIQGIDFLGYVILPHHIVVRTKTKRRIFKKLYKKHELWTRQKIDDYSFRQSLESYLGMVGHSDGYDLENIIKNTFGKPIN